MGGTNPEKQNAALLQYSRGARPTLAFDLKHTMRLNRQTGKFGCRLFQCTHVAKTDMYIDARAGRADTMSSTSLRNSCGPVCMRSLVTCASFQLRNSGALETNPDRRHKVAVIKRIMIKGIGTTAFASSGGSMCISFSISPIGLSGARN